MDENEKDNNGISASEIVILPFFKMKGHNYGICRKCGKNHGNSYTQNPENCKKMHESQIGKPRFDIRGDNHYMRKNPELCKNLYILQKGIPRPWLIGDRNVMRKPEIAAKLKHPRSEETCKKISLAKTGKKRPDMVGDNNPMRNPEIAAKLKKPRPLEVGIKISKTTKGKPKPGIRGQKNGNYGEKFLLNHDGGNPWKGHNWGDCKKCGKFHVIGTNRKRTPLQIENMKKAFVKRNTPLYRQRQSKAQKEKWKDDEFVRKQIKSRRQIRQTKPEKKLERLINKISPNNYKFVGDGSIIIGGKSPDFINVNGEKKIIEHFGCFFHGCPLCFPNGGLRRRGIKIKDNSAERIKIFKKFGYDTLIIWEHELETESIVEEILRRFMGVN